MTTNQTEWLAGYAVTVYGKDNNPVTVYYVPTLADFEREFTNELQLGVFAPDNPTKFVAEWHDELIPIDNPRK